MTVPATPRRAGPFTGNGATTSFPFTYKVFSEDDVRVVRAAGGLETTLVRNSDYSVTLNSDQDSNPGGSITYPLTGAPLPSGETLTIAGALEYTQELDLPSGGNFSPRAIEDALDRVVVMVQQLDEVTDRALTLPVSATSGVSTQLPVPVANNVIGWDETAQALVNLNPASLATVVVAGTSYLDVFDGTGAQTQFVLTANPGSVNALDIAISGVSQVNGVDFTVSGTTLTFTDAPPAGDGNIAVRYVAALPVGTANAQDVTYEPGSGSPPTNVQAVLRESISVLRRGARGDGVTDDTAAIQQAINEAAAGYAADWFTPAAYTAPRVVDFPSRVYKITSKILVPRGVVLRGNNSTILGTGFGSGDTDGFESAYYNAGVLTSNIGTAPETRRLQYTRIEGFKFVNLRTAINLFNFNEGCAVRDCAFYNVRQAVVAERCFYGEFTGLMNRGSAGGATQWCFIFTTFVNVETIRNVTVVDRVNAIQISGGVNGQLLTAVNCESCTNGIQFVGEVNPLNIDSCYFEQLAAGGIALDFTDTNAKRAVTIDNCWFAQITAGTAIKGVQMLSGRIGAGNYFLNVATHVDIQDNVSTITVEIPPSRASSGFPSLPAQYLLGAAIRTIYPVHAFEAATGITKVRQDYSGGVVALPYSGAQGFVPSQVAFCVKSTTGTTTMTGYIDTRIVFDAYVAFVYAMTITDNAGAYFLAGRGYGTAVVADVTSAGKTVTASNNGGFLRLTITGLTHPTGVMGAEGVVRIV